MTSIPKKNLNKISLLFILIVLIITGYTLASDSKTSQSVKITVPPIRAVYLDNQDRIIGVFSNVQVIDDGRLQVFQNGLEIAVSEKTLEHYRKMESTVDWSGIGWVYLQIDPKAENKNQPPEIKQTKDERPAISKSNENKEA
ncbi:MAG: hypothetical protein ACYST2_05325 [Planctomycetota bacterium]|jgi:hypothetical protein